MSLTERSSSFPNVSGATERSGTMKKRIEQVYEILPNGNLVAVSKVFVHKGVKCVEIELGRYDEGIRHIKQIHVSLEAARVLGKLLTRLHQTDADGKTEDGEAGR